MNYNEQLSALKERAKQAEKAVNEINRVNARIASKQAEIAAISAEATGPAAKLRARLCGQLENLEASRSVAITEADLALAEPFQSAALA